MKTQPPSLTSLPQRLKVWREVILSSAQRLGQVDAFDLAGSLTFTTVLAIVPLLAVALALFTAFPQFHDFSDALQAFLTNSLMPPVISENVMSYLNDFAKQASRLTAIGGSFLVITVLLLILSVDKALNEIWRVTKPRGIGQRLLVYWALLTLGPLMTGASLWATALLARESFGVIAQIPELLEFTLKVSPFFVSAAGFAALFVIVPNTKVTPRDAMIGGLLVAALLEIMKLGFAYYVSQVSTYTMIYGAFAALPVFLIWVYLSWLSVLFGAIVAANLPYFRHVRARGLNQSNDVFNEALSILRLLDQSRSQSSSGLSIRSLSETLELTEDQIDKTLASLQDLGWVAQAQVRKREVWVLVCNPSTTSINPLIKRLLVNRSPLKLEENPALKQALLLYLKDNQDSILADVLLQNDKSDTLTVQSNKSSTKETHHVAGQ
ncbi:Rbn Ribonuclease BN family enzyme [Burkholderiaceae bacterium]